MSCAFNACESSNVVCSSNAKCFLSPGAVYKLILIAISNKASLGTFQKIVRQKTCIWSPQDFISRLIHLQYFHMYNRTTQCFHICMFVEMLSVFIPVVQSCFTIPQAKCKVPSHRVKPWKKKWRNSKTEQTALPNHVLCDLFFGCFVTVIRYWLLIWQKGGLGTRVGILWCVLLAGRECILTEVLWSLCQRERKKLLICWRGASEITNSLLQKHKIPLEKWNFNCDFNFCIWKLLNFFIFVVRHVCRCVCARVFVCVCARREPCLGRIIVLSLIWMLRGGSQAFSLHGLSLHSPRSDAAVCVNWWFEAHSHWHSRLATHRISVCARDSHTCRENLYHWSVWDQAWQGEGAMHSFLELGIRLEGQQGVPVLAWLSTGWL